MKRLHPIVFSLLVVCAASLATPALINAQAPVREVLNNESVVHLVKAKFKETTILSLIRTSPVSFDITTAKLVQLKRSGVNEKIITAMIERQTSLMGMAANMGDFGSLGEDEFFRQGDEEFFKRSNPSRTSPNSGNNSGNGGGQSNETDIFGSRSGGRNKTESRGMGPGPNGSSSGSTETMGSASVRIIRPPSEAGSGGEPKLQRQPKLDNKAVLELIEAGFSEGTILRKIENSQVNFDLSAKSLADLRKNRVSESIIKAMSEAMGIEAK
ncbi:MAG: hypothetical protein HOP19_17655 [Acidobacteria bacterium]|nr:hypothetical protein [Acidobacteriota bacterium]